VLPCRQGGGRVALNFHPDRVAADGRMVVEGLLRDGVYRSQFETGISNGGLGAVREGFEARLFAGLYARSEVSPAERPRYGGLDLVGHPDGPCPRFGSCHLRLRPEVQVHGPVRLADDVEALVADPSFRRSRMGELLGELASGFGFELSWHHGFHLEAQEVPAEFRGPDARVVARRVAADFGGRSDRIDAEVLGRAARSVVTNPKQWADHGERAETLQYLKQLWHVLVAYGRPADNQSGQ
jgi:hypothetical protein